MVSRCGRTCELVQAYRSKLCRVTSAACTINSYSNVTYFEVFSTRYHICWPPCYVTPDLSYYWERENRRVKIINGCDKTKKKKKQWKRGWHGQFFWSGPWTGRSGDNVSPPTTGLQKGQWWSGVSAGIKTFIFHVIFWTSRLQPFQGVSVKTFTRNIPRSGANIKSYLPPKLDSMLRRK